MHFFSSVPGQHLDAVTAALNIPYFCCTICNCHIDCTWKAEILATSLDDQAVCRFGKVDPLSGKKGMTVSLDIEEYQHFCEFHGTPRIPGVMSHLFFILPLWCLEWRDLLKHLLYMCEGGAGRVLVDMYVCVCMDFSAYTVSHPFRNMFGCFVSWCLCTCIYIRIGTHTLIHKKHIRNAYMKTCIRIVLGACAWIWNDANLHVHAYNTHSHMHIYTHTCIRTMHTYIHTYTYIQAMTGLENLFSRLMKAHLGMSGTPCFLFMYVCLLTCSSVCVCVCVCVVCACNPIDIHTYINVGT